MEKNVSVIIPTFNRAHILRKTVPTYIQDITLEVILVDDGSDDYTREVVNRLHKQYTEIKYVRLNQHKGITYAKNAGVKKASGKYIYFGDDDAVLYDGSLKRLRMAIETFPADIAGAHGSYAECRNQVEQIEKYIEDYFTVPFQGRCVMDFDTGKLNFHYKIGEITEGLCVMACFMIKAELAKNMKYDNAFKGNGAREDMDYLLQNAEMGRRMVYVPETYEIDLPYSMVKGGGCRSLRFWENIFCTIHNFNYFIDKHYMYMKKEGYISVSKKRAKWILVKSIIFGSIIPRLRIMLCKVINP